MRWRTGRRSANIEDRRGQRGVRGMGRGTKMGGGMALLAVVAALIFGADPSQIIGMMGGGGEVSSPAPRQQTGGANDEAAAFVSVVLADTEDTWGSLFGAAGQRYQTPKLVLFTDMVQSACGSNSAAAGPFYCPGDHKVYLDLSFLRELQNMGASGDFSVAYVIAHEVGHHVQNLLGISSEVRRMQQQVGKVKANSLSVLTELQADCFAGVWAHHAHKQREILERGDVEEGLGAAASVGDDRLQKMSGRGVHPESFTHGTSEQRMQWFSTGLETGSSDACNTFARAGL